MGREEKVNPRSWWYRKRHPAPVIPKEPIIVHKETGPENRVVKFIKNLFKKE
jgi:hypothetical protein